MLTDSVDACTLQELLATRNTMTKPAEGSAGKLPNDREAALHAQHDTVSMVQSAWYTQQKWDA